ncbi:type II toxin-antitoxin system RelE/ParE family toxin [bacterium]|nr:type II toxin-antitoxin system RelE/ParE family toxin [bacterium]
MYDVYIYEKTNGRSPFIEYLDELTSQKTKDSIIRLTKIRAYVKALSEKGNLLPVTMFEHLDGDIWELRPSKDRVLLAGWHNGSFVLLHCFMKKTQKTPRREIEQAINELEDFRHILEMEAKRNEQN